MTLLERLQAHRGGLLRIKSELFWYDGRGWDGVRGRICLLLDAAADTVAAADTGATLDLAAAPRAGASALLLIDGAPHWVWVVSEDIELLDGGDR